MSKEDADHFVLPKNSFTAFRLMYCSAPEAGELAKTVFLGKVPDTWYCDQEKGLIATISKKARSSVRERLKSSYESLHRSVLLLSRTRLDRIADAVDDDLINKELYEKNNLLAAQLRNIAFSNTHDKMEELVDSDSDNEPQCHASSLETDSILDSPAHFDRLLYPPDSSDDSWLNSLYETLPNETPATRPESVNDSYAVTEQPDDAKEEDSAPKVRFDDDVKSHEKNEISFINPIPEGSERGSELDREVVVSRKKKYKTLRKIKQFTGHQRRRGASGAAKFKSKVVLKIVSSFKPGEIVQVNKMLAQIRVSDSCSSIEPYTERCSMDTRIADRWKEYYVLLRNIDDIKCPLLVQLYDVNGSKNFDRKPDHEFPLSVSATSGFYSNSDKSISIVVPDHNGVRIAVLNPRFETLAFKWLFLLKEIVGDQSSTAFNISVPGVGIKVRLFLPLEIAEAIVDSSPDLEMEVLPFGYKVSEDVAQRYLKTQVLASIEKMARSNELAQIWLKMNPDPWFCFKFYDRIEWASVNSRLFFMQNKLNNDHLQLEFNQWSRTPLTVASPLGVINRPYPVEGFLARLTDTHGKQVSHFRYFYKISYFSTVDNMLFFTKFFRALPPPRFCTSLSDDPDKAREAGLMHAVSVTDPFQIDQAGHIPWLRSEDFAKHDEALMDEFRRRISQVATAEAVIDLTEVKLIHPEPFKLLLHHHYFQSLLWHSSPGIVEEEELLDCAFEIELHNGSSFKLMASSSAMRDEWVRRLTDISEFYKLLLAQKVEKSRGIRRKNMKKLHIGEHTDSNIINEYHGFETDYSEPFLHIYDQTALAMTNCVLHSGHLYQKYKKHASFRDFFVTLCPGYLILFSYAKRTLATGTLKDTPTYEHYLSIPISECYIYSGNLTDADLVDTRDGGAWASHAPRIYPDGWKSSEEESQLCFTLWFGKKRKLRRNLDIAKNPHLVTMIRKLGVTGKSMVFMARSRVQRESWVQKIHLEIDRFSG